MSKKKYDETDRRMAGAALQMLMSARLSGNEVQNFIAINNWLQMMMMSGTESEPEQVDNMVEEPEPGKSH